MASKPFVGVSNSAAARKKFCATAKTFLQKNKFDGLDFDWEYPAQRGGTPDDKKNFALLVKVRILEKYAFHPANSFLKTQTVFLKFKEDALAGHRYMYMRRRKKPGKKCL